jgi:ABC-2 type transport system permease protein
MRNLWLVIKREFYSRVRKPGYLWLTLAGPVLIALAAILAIQIGKGAEKQRVLVIDPYHILNESLENGRLATYEYSETDVTNEFFKKSRYDLILFVNEKFATNNKVIIQYKKRPSPYVVSEIVRQLEYRLERLKLDIHGVNREAYARIKQPVDFRVVNIDGVYAEYDLYSGYAGIAFGIVIFFFIALYGVQVMRGVVEEKTSRVIEVLASSVRPIHLMGGKIIGIGLAAMLQFMLWCILTFVMLQVVRQEYYPDRYKPENVARVQGDGTAIAEDGLSMEVNDVAEIIYSAINYPVMLAYFLFFFVFGYLMYAAIFASVGAMSRGDSDQQPWTIPLLLPLLLGFAASWTEIQQPGSAAGTWGSLIPFTSPVTMMTRIAHGMEAAEIWQLWASMGLLIVAFLFFTWLSSRIYRSGIISYGRKVRLRDLF